jgi:hypothetical protein
MVHDPFFKDVTVIPFTLQTSGVRVFADSSVDTEYGNFTDLLVILLTEVASLLIKDVSVFASEIDVDTLEIRETISFGVPVISSFTSSTLVSFTVSEELKTELVEVVRELDAEVVAVEVSEFCITDETVVAVLESETIGDMTTAVLPLPEEVLPVGCMNVYAHSSPVSP